MQPYSLACCRSGLFVVLVEKIRLLLIPPDTDFQYAAITYGFHYSSLEHS